MKKIIRLSVLLLPILLSGCMNSTEKMEVNSPAQTAAEMKFFAGLEGDFNGYEDFRKLFDEQRSEDYIEEKYQLLQKIESDDASISTLALVEYENDRKLLVRLRDDPDTGEYLIYDIIEVPEDVAAFFEEKLD